jgi:UDP-N-acetylmuramate--alanine ligase
MLPLALILKGRGAKVSGSDRSFDQGRTPEKSSFLKSQGIDLFPQDGSGISLDYDALVVSGAVEPSIPDVRKAQETGLPIVTRAELLSRLFNSAESRVAVAGTSGKSTTTGMIGYVLHSLGKNPTVMNGAVFRNFADAENPYATALVGSPGLFVTECDESDGSIALYHPTIGVLNNIALDHKAMDELTSLFRDYLGVSEQCVVNLDNPNAQNLAREFPGKVLGVGIGNQDARIAAEHITAKPDGISCRIIDRKTGDAAELTLQSPGEHNIQNALSCLGVTTLLGIPLAEACGALAGFTGVRRRMEVVGTAKGITVIDDFAHNPDKIAATLKTLKVFPGRLLILFQMHGFGPLKLLRRELAESFQNHLDPKDILFMPEVLYLGGTAERSVTAQDFIGDLKTVNIDARWFETRDQIAPALLTEARAGDRIVIMGARDDTLSAFAANILKSL